DDLLPLLQRKVLHRNRGRSSASVVEEHVEPPERILRRLAERLHRRRIGDIGRHRQHAPTTIRGHGCRTLELLLTPASQYDMPTLPLQGECCCPPDSAASAGDEGDLACAAHDCCFLLGQT